MRRKILLQRFFIWESSRESREFSFLSLSFSSLSSAALPAAVAGGAGSAPREEFEDSTCSSPKFVGDPAKFSGAATVIGAAVSEVRRRSGQVLRRGHRDRCGGLHRGRRGSGRRLSDDLAPVDVAKEPLLASPEAVVGKLPPIRHDLTKSLPKIKKKKKSNQETLTGAMSTLAAKQSLAGIKNALRLLTLLDYYDPQKLHNLPHGTTLTTTLYQTTGNAPGNSGFVNITNLRGGHVAFAAAAHGSKLDSSYTKTVCEVPYNLSILEISEPIVFPGLLDAPSAASSNLTALLEKAGCKTFASLLTSSGVLKIFQSAMEKGLTLFAPNDEAFKDF